MAETRSVEESVRSLKGWEARTLVVEPALPVLASPSWRGVDGTPLRVTDSASGETLFVKAMDPDATFTIDVACAFEAAQRASDLGIGPRVLLADAASGHLVMEDLAATHETAGLHTVLDPAIVDKALSARKAFQAGPPLPRTSSVFDEIERFLAACLEAGAQLPADAEWLAGELRAAAEALRPRASHAVPVHGDGNVSNLLVSASGDVRLVDWDRACNADPLEDLGVALREYHAAEPEALATFRRCGGTSEADFDRAWTYAIADDLRWGLIGALVSARSPRTTMEFYKYASWRFLRCRMAVREPRFSERLRRL